MKLFIVHMHSNNPPMIMFGETRAKVGRTVKKMLGPDMVDEVVPISRQDAEIEFGDSYMKQARWNMLRSEEVSKGSVLTGDNPFLREKMDMKKADMGDVIDDFKSSDAPQFAGKSDAKKRKMAIAAKLQANEEVKELYKLSAVAEGIDQKVLKTFKTMIKDGEQDSVMLLLQGMPKHSKRMYMSRLGIKEDNKIDARTKAFKETVSRLNKAKVSQNDLEEKTPIKPVIQHPTQKNLKIPNPNYKKKTLPIERKNKRSADLHIETKEAPAGTYFTKSGQLKKGDPASDGKGGEKLASDPLDKQRKTIVNLKNYPK